MPYGGYLFQCGPAAPHSANEMTCWPASARVGNAKNNDPGLRTDCGLTIFAARVAQRRQILPVTIDPYSLAAKPMEMSFRSVIPEIDIWRAANLMLKRYGDQAEAKSAARADELAAGGDHNGEAVWRRITDAVAQLTNQTRPGPMH
jgi:hypothetical protein